MQRTIIVVITLVELLFGNRSAISQESNIIPFTSIDPSNSNFDDLQFLKNEIGDKKIVLIGEQDHGAGASIDAKARICNYLIKELGFKVVLFESGFYDVNRTVEYDSINNANKFKNSLYFFWSKNKHIANFLDSLGAYAKQNKLQLEGFDPKFTSSVASKFYLTDLEQVLKKINYSHADQLEWETFKKLIQTASNNYDKPIPKFNDADRQLLAKVSAAIGKALISSNENYWFTMVKYNTQLLIEYSKMHLKDFVMMNEKSQKLDSFRDSLMAESVKFFVETKYKGQKVIIWAASYHIIQDPNIITSTGKHSIRGKKIMGDILSKNYPDRIYSIGFISNKGNYGIYFNKPKRKEIKPHSEDSLEKFLKSTGNQFCFVKLKNNAWVKDKSATIVGFNNGSYTSTDWSRNFDALIYLEYMYPNVLK